jgi:hypothetical protein
MSEAGVRIERLAPHDGDRLDFFRVSATDGRFAGYLDFYEYETTLRGFAVALQGFSRREGCEARLEIGTPKDTEYLLLRAHLTNQLSHAALEVQVDNGRVGRHSARANFTLDCELAALNRMGEELAIWLAEPARPFTWRPVRERL